MLTDLFGYETTPPAVPHGKHTGAARPHRKDPEALRRKALKQAEQNPTLWLFDEVLEFLCQPLLDHAMIPQQYRSDRANVVPAQEEEVIETTRVHDHVIPFEPWGPAWLMSEHQGGVQLPWSYESVQHLQHLVFWESMEEMALSYNEQEKWDILKWVFRPAIRKYYIWDARIGKSHCYAEHESDQTFSFHNCCMAARMDEDHIRDGFRRNLPAEVINAVLRAITQ